jgi:DNA-binding transcriptional regulator YiaG
LGIAERQIHIKFDQNIKPKKTSNPLPANAQTIGDWIRIRRTEKNLTSGHLAFKMGIADCIVRSWENGSRQPDGKQLTFLVNFFGSDPKKEANIAAPLFLSQPGTQQSVYQTEPPATQR